MTEFPGGILTAMDNRMAGLSLPPTPGCGCGWALRFRGPGCLCQKPTPQQPSYLLSLITFYEGPRPGLQESRGGLRGHPLDAILLTKSGPRQVKRLPPAGPHGLDAWSPAPGVVWACLIKACLCPVTAGDPRRLLPPGAPPACLRSAPAHLPLNSRPGFLNESISYVINQNQSIVFNSTINCIGV